jgi:hypothetical protein
LTFEERKSILKWYIKFENVAEVQRQWKREKCSVLMRQEIFFVQIWGAMVQILHAHTLVFMRIAMYDSST